MKKKLGMLLAVLLTFCMTVGVFADAGKTQQVDYKTDYIEKNKKYELVNKYKKQLELYQEALEQSFNKKVSKKYIYSTCLGQAIEI